MASYPAQRIEISLTITGTMIVAIALYTLEHLLALPASIVPRLGHIGVVQG